MTKSLSIYNTDINILKNGQNLESKAMHNLTNFSQLNPCHEEKFYFSSNLQKKITQIKYYTVCRYSE